MSRKNRLQSENAYYHIYNRGVDQQPIFRSEIDYRLFLSLLGQTAEVCQLEIYAYCLMINHYHLFLKTHCPNLSKALWHLSHQYCRAYNFRHSRVGPVFQGRFRSEIVDIDQYAVVLLRYIHLNPVEAGIVNSPEAYPWSSYGCYTNKFPSHSWLNKEWGMRLISTEKDSDLRLKHFITHHNEGARLEPGTFGYKISIASP